MVEVWFRRKKLKGNIPMGSTLKQGTVSVSVDRNVEMVLHPYVSFQYQTISHTVKSSYCQWDSNGHIHTHIHIYIFNVYLNKYEQHINIYMCIYHI